MDDDDDGVMDQQRHDEWKTKGKQSEGKRYDTGR